MTEIECSQNSIEVIFLTRDIFNGRIFVRGHSRSPGCFSRDIGKRLTSIKINTSMCNVKVAKSVIILKLIQYTSIQLYNYTRNNQNISLPY